MNHYLIDYYILTIPPRNNHKTQYVIIYLLIQKVRLSHHLHWTITPLYLFFFSKMSVLVYNAVCEELEMKQWKIKVNIDCEQHMWIISDQAVILWNYADSVKILLSCVNGYLRYMKY